MIFVLVSMVMAVILLLMMPSDDTIGEGDDRYSDNDIDWNLMVVK